MTKHVKNPLQRLIAMLLCVVMVVGFMPVAANAAEDELPNNAIMLTDDAQDNMVLNKGATLESDGTFTIDLSAYATGDSVTKEVNMAVPMDIVFVLDSSGSMVGSTNDISFDKLRAKALYTAVRTFVEKINNDSVANGATTPETEHQVGVVTFAGAASGSGTVWKWGGVNGNIDYFCNTGLFVNGKFKNYKVKNSTATVEFYEPVWNLDTTKQYVCFAGTYNETDGEQSYIRTSTYKNGKWTDEGGTKTPMTKPYESASRRQFMEVTNRTASDTVVTTNDYKNALMGIVTERDYVYESVDKIVAKGSTYTEYGMLMALNILKNNPARTYENPLTGKTESVKRIVILFTDGNTDSVKDTVGGYADQIKGLGASIYTVGVGELNSDNETFLQKLSSNYSSYGASAATADKYYFSASQTDKINEFFEKISGDVTTSSSTVNLDETSQMRDYLQDGFVLPDDFSADDVEIVVQRVHTEDDTTYTFGEEIPCTQTGADSYTFKDLDNKTVTLTMSYDRDENYVDIQGFNYAKYYAAKEHDGLMLKVKIKGIVMTENVSMDTVITTNKPISGIGAVIDGQFVAPYKFPMPTTKSMTRAYVMDYAKSIEIFPCEWFKTVIGMGDVPTITKNDTVKTQYGNFVGEEVEDHVGAIEGHNHLKVVFNPTTTEWDNAAELFLFGVAADSGDTLEGVTTGDYMWGKINVIPANNIYYEDDFTTVTDPADSNNDRVGIEYSGNWTVETEKNSGSNTESAEGTAGDTEGVHGWQESLADDTGYSDGSGHYADASVDSAATATFTFTGTGVDIYSRTNGKTGTVIATLKGSSDDGISVSKGIIVDNLAESGDYFQIPTLSFHSYKSNGQEIALPYGTYTVTIKVTTGADDNGDKVCDRFIYYLDGIRVYNPMQEQSGYAPEERNAIFKEVRDMLLDAKSFGEVTEGETSVAGAVFIDSVHADQAEGNQVGTPTMTTDVLGIYEDYGPKNEVYLKAGQSITFKVNPKGQYYYIGLKAPNINGTQEEYKGAATALVSNGQDSEGKEVNKEIAINHSTDLYYKVVPDAEGYITIKNNGGGLLSVTKIRATGDTANGIQLQGMTEEEALEAVKLFSARPVVDTEEEPVDPNAPVEPEQPDVEIDNPTEPEQPGAVSPAAALLRKMLKRLFTSLSGWFN